MIEHRQAAIKVKIKSLAAEARIIREQSKKYGGKWASVAGGLRQHNIDVVRPETRATLIAYAFLRGIAYRVIEKDAKSPVPIDAVFRNVQRFADYKAKHTKEEVEKWGSVPCGRQPAFNPA